MTRLKDFLLLVGMVCAAGITQLHAQGCDCKIALKNPGTSVNSIDGIIDNEWSDADVLDTSLDSSCLKSLLDWNQTSVSQPYDSNLPAALSAKGVKVLSKRDGSNIYLAFQVKDQTQDRRAPGAPGTSLGKLSYGEKIIVQLDPNASRGSQMENGGTSITTDYRFEITHFWDTDSNQKISLSASPTQLQFFKSTTAAGSSPCNVEDWSAGTAFPSGSAVAAHNDGAGVTGGYTIELKIPLSAIGSPSSDVGVAFAVVNDLGFDPNNTPRLTGSGLPAALPLNAVSGPLLDTDPAGCGGWRTPNGWGTGYFTNAAPSVEIARSNPWWDSTSIEAFPCAADTSNYTYYRTKACKILLRADITNTGTSNQSRNLLYVWADNGPSPSVWRVVDLKEGQTIAPGGTKVAASLWDAPSGLMNHPCVRVYILPNSFDPAFDKTAILGIHDNAGINSLETTYSLGTKCWTQRNLSIVDPGTCPNCPSTASNGRESAPILQASFGGFLSSLFAQTATVPPKNGQIQWSPEEERRFGENNIVAQFRSFGITKSGVHAKRSYEFIEELGGALQLYPVEVVKKTPVLPIQIEVGNPGTVARTISVVVDTRVPAGFGNFGINIDTGPHDYKVGETRTVRGEASTLIPAGCFGRSQSTGAIFLLSGLLLTGIVVHRSRRKKDGHATL